MFRFVIHIFIKEAKWEHMDPKILYGSIAESPGTYSEVWKLSEWIVINTVH